MAFFDDLGKKLSQAGQSVAQKTKDFTEVSKLNSAISDEEKKISNICVQLGREYYAKHVSDYEAPFEPYVLGIKDAEDKIAAYRQQIQNIRGVVRCENCGAELAPNVPFCSGCGAPAPVKAPAVAEPGMVLCSACRNAVPVGIKFCPSCGASMSPAEPVTPAPIEAIQPMPANQQPVQDNASASYPTGDAVYAPASSGACASCGAELQPGLEFCTNCGTKIG